MGEVRSTKPTLPLKYIFPLNHIEEGYPLFNKRNLSYTQHIAGYVKII